MKVVLTGSTGHLGSIVVRQLLYRKPAHEITVCVRKPEAADDWRRQGVGVTYGDYDVPDSLEPAFRGASKLLLISSPHPDDAVRLRQHTAAIHAARQAGVRHIVYTSVACAERGRLPLHRLHLQTEQAIRESLIPYTILRNAFYMDIVKFLGVREAAASGVLVSPPGEWIFNTASREDLALAAVAVLTEEGHENRTYELTASRAWKLPELARAVSESTGRHIAYRTDPAMKSNIYELLTCSDMAFVSPDLANLIGRPLRSLTDEVSAMF